MSNTTTFNNDPNLFVPFKGKWELKTTKDGKIIYNGFVVAQCKNEQESRDVMTEAGFVQSWGIWE